MKRTLLFICSLFVCTSALAGAWGVDTFENDDALDWVAQCARSAGSAEVSAALEAAIAAKYLEAPEGSAALAAAEVVAAALGKPSSKLPTELASWLARQPKQQIAQLAPRARLAVARVKDAGVSELRQLWSEGKPDQWLSRVEKLELRLGR